MGGWVLALQSGAPSSQRTSMDPGTSWAKTEVAERISVKTKTQAARFRSRRIASALAATQFRRIWIPIPSLVILNTVSSDNCGWCSDTGLFYEGANHRLRVLQTGRGYARRLVIVLLHCL